MHTWMVALYVVVLDVEYSSNVVYDMCRCEVGELQKEVRVRKGDGGKRASEEEGTRSRGVLYATNRWLGLVLIAYRADVTCT